jgi:hypothetical protein
VPMAKDPRAPIALATPTTPAPELPQTAQLMTYAQEAVARLKDWVDYLEWAVSPGGPAEALIAVEVEKNPGRVDAIKRALLTEAQELVEAIDTALSSGIPVRPTVPKPVAAVPPIAPPPAVVPEPAPVVGNAAGPEPPSATQAGV